MATNLRREMFCRMRLLNADIVAVMQRDSHVGLTIVANVAISTGPALLGSRGPLYNNSSLLCERDEIRL